ncbi:PPA1309 family protein [Nocardioides marmoraquaticus]
MTTSPSPESAADQLRTSVLEVERHAAAAGWDRPAQVFALVETADLLRREPQLAAVLGVDDADAAGLTPVEQEAAVDSLEELLPTIAWPDEVAGCAVVVEATTVPPDRAAGAVPDDPESAARWAAEHPDREEARVVAGVLRTGESWCAIRQRAHDDDTMVMSGADLVPSLLDLLHTTFVPEPEGPTDPDE